MPTWFLQCNCDQQKCCCNARLKPDILCVKGLPYQNDPPQNPVNNLTIQFIEFTYCNDKFPQEAINNKIQKYQPLLNNITNQGWKVDPLIVSTAGARGTTHVPSMKHISSKFRIPKTCVKHTFKKINTIAIHHASSILLHKKKIENNQLLPIDSI